MSTPRTIKKYPNRRLYDTTESRYITRADVQKMVIDRIDFVVIDKTSKQDITRNILLQIISQQEGTREPLMSRDFLSRVIRSHDRSTSPVTASYLEQSMKLLTTHMEAGAIAKEADVLDSAAVGGLAQRNYKRWRSVEEKICRTLDAACQSAIESTQLPSPLPTPPMVIDRPHAAMALEAGG